ncbi:hypothetical protein [Amycolatopsis sp. NPDC059021]|uniref:hypothetical protein n=1 Tax=Amycolatopsis sp. NPDC059021 TaxID=3346704 RepID=UPI00366F880C
MSALIYLDLAHIHPIVNGQWYRARLVHVPQPGEAVTMLCGVSAAAEYDESGRRDARGPAAQC